MLYATIKQADDYFNARLSADEWAQFSNNEKQKSLLSGSDYIDIMYEFIGHKTDVSQPREFPRVGIKDVDQETIPDRIVWACCELALIAGNNAVEGGSGLTVDRRDFAETRVKVDVIEVEYNAELLKDSLLGFGSGISDYVDMLLRPYLSSSRPDIGTGRLLRG